MNNSTSHASLPSISSTNNNIEFDIDEDVNEEETEVLLSITHPPTNQQQSHQATSTSITNLRHTIPQPLSSSSSSSYFSFDYLSSRLGISPRRILGVSLLLIVAIIWVSASALTQYLFINLHLQKPFLLTYINTTEFIILLPIRLLWEKYFPNGIMRSRISSPVSSSGTSSSTTASTSSLNFPEPNNVWFHPGKPTDWKLTFYTAMKISPIWFLAQSTYNWSLAGTSVSSSTILSTTSCVFTYLLSLCILHEKTNWQKNVGILCTVIGAILTGYADEQQPSDNTTNDSTWWGDSLALFSACMYAIYTTLIQKLMPIEGTISMSSLFGMIGLINGLTLWPIIIILNINNIEDLSSISLIFISLVLIKGLFDNVLSDLLWAKGIQLTNATLATVALSLTIPLAMLTDLLLHNKIPSLLLSCGSIAVCSGFIFTTVSLKDTSSIISIESAESLETETEIEIEANTIMSQTNTIMESSKSSDS